MNVIARTIFALLGSGTIILAADPPQAPLSGDDVQSIRRFLENTDKGNVENEALDNSEFRQKLLAYYQVGTNSISIKGKLAISTGFGRDKRYVEAIALAKEYVTVYSNDWEGLYLLGDFLVESGSYGYAIPVLTSAQAQIDIDDPTKTAMQTAWTDTQLATAALFTGRSDVLGSIAPKLVSATPGEFGYERYHQDAALALAAYAVGTHDKRLFLNAIKNLDMPQIVADSDLRLMVKLGCYVFPTDELASTRIALHDAVKQNLPPRNEQPQMSITGKETELVRGVLKDNEDDKIDLYATNDDELCRKLMGYYLTATNTVSTKSKLALSRCFGKNEQYAEAIKLAEDYVQVYSNDWRGWRIIGLLSYQEEAYGKACIALTNALALGGAKAFEVCSPLAMSALESDRLEIVRNLVPTLVKVKQSADTEAQVKSEIIFELMNYAIITNNRELFIRSLEGVTVEEILSRKSLRVALFIGWNFFKPKEIEPLWRAYRKAADAAEPKSG